MDLVQVVADQAQVSVSRTDLRLMLSAVGETLEALDEWEFQTRTGFTTSEFRKFRAVLKLIDEQIRIESTLS